MPFDRFPGPAADALETLRLRWRDARGRGPYAGFPNAERCIFIHVPKTAGTAVARALFDSHSRHIPCSYYRRANPKKFRDFFKFAFVRNPWGRLVSSYFYLKSGGQHEEDRAWAEQHLRPFDTFDQFVREWVAHGHVSRGIHFQPQTDFICDGPGPPPLDFIGRFETLATDFYRLAERLQKQALLLPSNATPHRPFREYYAPDTIEIVARAYARDLSELGYAYDPS